MDIIGVASIPKPRAPHPDERAHTQPRANAIVCVCTITGGYSNDDIFFMEVCAYSLVCANRNELFKLRAEQPFTCQVSQQGFRKLQALLTSA